MISKKELLDWIDENLFVTNESKDLDVVSVSEILHFIHKKSEKVKTWEDD